MKENKEKTLELKKRDNSSIIYSYPCSQITQENNCKGLIHIKVDIYEPPYLIKNTLITSKAIHNIIKELKFNNKQRINAYVFIERLLIKSNQINIRSNTDSKWIELPVAYLIKTYGKRYTSWFNELKKAKIVIAKKNSESKETYVAKNITTNKLKPKSKSYKINVNLIDEIITLNKLKIKDRKVRDNIYKNIDKIITMEFIGKEGNLDYRFRKVNSKYKVIPSICFPKMVRTVPVRDVDDKTAFLNEKTIANINLLKINFKKLKTISKNYINNTVENNIVIDMDIPHIGYDDGFKIRYCYFDTDGVFQITDKEKYYISSLAREHKKGKHVCYYNGEYFSVNSPKTFIKILKNRIKTSYNISIAKLEVGEIYSSRNDVNMRLDSNLTNLAGLLTNEILRMNKLVQFDLSNSQFSILAHIGGDKLDKGFVIRSQDGMLYEALQMHFGGISRSEAKVKMFELFFSNINAYKETKRELSEILPKTVEFVEDYKKEHGYKNFAIMLQKFESELFIDNILYRIMKEGYFALSKHDSIICKREDKTRIHNIIQEEFDKIGFIGNLKEE